MNKPKKGHTAFSTGAKIRIIFLDGTVLIAKFKQKIGKARGIRTDKGDFHLINIRSINYYKPLPHELER